MKKWVLRFRAKDWKGFEDIRRGLKKVETRAATERYRKIKAGDRLVFDCGKARFERRVKRVRLFRSIGAMFSAINYRKIMPQAESPEKARRIYYGYSGYKEKIGKFGIVAFDLS